MRAPIREAPWKGARRAAISYTVLVDEGRFQRVLHGYSHPFRLCDLCTANSESFRGLRAFSNRQWTQINANAKKTKRTRFCKFASISVYSRFLFLVVAKGRAVFPAVKKPHESCELCERKFLLSLCLCPWCGAAGLHCGGFIRWLARPPASACPLRRLGPIRDIRVKKRTSTVGRYLFHG